MNSQCFSLNFHGSMCFNECATFSIEFAMFLCEFQMVFDEFDMNCNGFQWNSHVFLMETLYFNCTHWICNCLNWISNVFNKNYCCHWRFIVCPLIFNEVHWSLSNLIISIEFTMSFIEFQWLDVLQWVRNLAIDFVMFLEEFQMASIDSYMNSIGF